MSDVFIAYKREDRARAEALRALLHALGVSTWFDAELEIGVEWRPQIAQQIAAAQAVIVCWTPAACASAHVAEEARAGLRRGVLAPVRFEACELAPPFAIVRAVDLCDWRGGFAHAGVRELLSRLECLLGRALTPAPADQTAR